MLSPLMPLLQALTLMLRLTPGTGTTGTGTDLMAMGTMATDLMVMDTTTERGLLMLSPLMPLLQALTLMLRLTPGTGTTGTGTDLMAMGTMATDLTVMDTTTERGLLMPSPLMPLLQALTLMLRLTPGTGTTATDLMVMLTGDKKWTSRTTSDLFLPTHL